MEFRFVYTGLRVRDIERSLQFYTEILGMEVVDPLESYEPTRGKAVTVRSPGSSQLLELNWYEEGSRFGTAYVNGEELDHLGFEVEGLQDAVKRLEEKGVEVVVRPGTIGGELGWREAFVKDPDGIWIELVQRKKPAWVLRYIGQGGARGCQCAHLLPVGSALSTGTLQLRRILSTDWWISASSRHAHFAKRIQAAKSMRRMYCPARPRWTTGAECRGRLGGDDGEAPRGWKGLGEAIARDRTRLVHDPYRRRGRQGSDCPRRRGAVVRDPGPLAGDRLEPRRHPRWHSEPRNDLRVSRPGQHRRPDRRRDRSVSRGSGRLPHRRDLHPVRGSEHEERRHPPRRRGQPDEAGLHRHDAV